MKNFLIVLSLLMCYGNLHSQVVTVTDKENGQLLERATLTSEAPKAFVNTNARGQADISGFRGSGKIEIRFMGYKTECLSFEQLEQDHFIVELSLTEITLDQAVISATRWKESKREVPNTITVINLKDIVLYNPQTAADLLGAAGDIFIQKSQMGGGSPMIRGFSANRLLITVDGVRMNSAIFRSDNLQNVISLDPFSMENIEVLHSSGSVIYGSDAVGGVMSFQTLTPELSLDDKPLVSGKAVARYSTANHEFTGHFDVNAGWKKWASTLSFTTSDYGDLRMGSYGPDDYLRYSYVQRQDSTDAVITNEDPLVQKPTAYSQMNLLQKVRFKLNGQWIFDYGFHYSTTSDYPRYDRHIRYKNGIQRSAEWYYGPQQWMMNDLNITHIASSTVYDQIEIRLASQNFEESRIDRDMNDTEKRKRVEKVNALSANLDLVKSLRSVHTLFYGLEAVYDKVKSVGTNEDISTGIISAGPSRYPQATWASYAAYLMWKYRISPEFSLQAGSRYNQYQLEADFDTTFYHFPFVKASINQGALTGSLGMDYNPTEKWTLRVNLNTGFRAPNVDDAGKVFDSQPGTVIVPNTDLKAEYAWNAEAGFAKVFGDWLRLECTAYYSILDDAMVIRAFSLNGQDSIYYDGELCQVKAEQNAATAVVYGIETGVEINLPAGFSFSSAFSWQKGEEEMEDGSTSPLRSAPPFFGSTHLKLEVQKINMEFYTVYNGEKSFADLPAVEQDKPHLYARDDNGKPYSPSWITLNFKAQYFFNNNISVNAGVENITDRRYRPYSSGIAAAGRNFVLSFQARF